MTGKRQEVKPPGDPAFLLKGAKVKPEPVPEEAVRPDYTKYVPELQKRQQKFQCMFVDQCRLATTIDCV